MTPEDKTIPDAPALLPDYPWSTRLRLTYLLYQVTLHLALPLLLVVLLLRSRAEPLYRKHLRQRFGRIRPRTKGRVLIFATSLGETRAASLVIEDLLKRGEQLLLTHGSPAGLTTGRALFADAIASGQIVQAYQPADLFWALRRLFRQHRPKLIIVVEAELWPGLMLETARARIPIVQINGNYTERAFMRDHGRRGMMRGALWRFYSLIITKSEERADRYRRAGVPDSRIRIVGELKFDLAINRDQCAAAAKANTALGGRPVLTIASSIEGEEEALFHILEKLKASCDPMPLIVWVPRSPQRFQAVAEAARARGYTVAMRSRSFDGRLWATEDISAADMLVGDSLREMDFYYSLGDIVFVGATLFPMGGHNIIEPLALERPVVTGPSLHGILYPALDAIEAGALIAEDDADALADTLTGLFADKAALDRFRASTKGFNARHKGASARTVALLGRYLERSQ